MSTTNENGKQPENTESPKQQASGCCGPGCGCESGAKPGKARWVIGVIVLAAAGVMVVRGMVKSDKGATQASPAGFANPAATETTAGGSVTNSETAAVDETTVGTTIGAFAELNTLAAKTDAVFVYLAGEGSDGGQGSCAADEGGSAADRGQGNQVRPFYPEARLG